MLGTPILTIGFVCVGCQVACMAPRVRSTSEPRALPVPRRHFRHRPAYPDVGLGQKERMLNVMPAICRAAPRVERRRRINFISRIVIECTPAAGPVKRKTGPIPRLSRLKLCSIFKPFAGARLAACLDKGEAAQVKKFIQRKWSSAWRRGHVNRHTIFGSSGKDDFAH
jgi:hypothetical protein